MQRAPGAFKLSSWQDPFRVGRHTIFSLFVFCWSLILIDLRNKEGHISHVHDASLSKKTLKSQVVKVFFCWSLREWIDTETYWPREWIDTETYCARDMNVWWVAWHPGAYWYFLLAPHSPEVWQDREEHALQVRHRTLNTTTRPLQFWVTARSTS
jgi:hypothetical protein